MTKRLSFISDNKGQGIYIANQPGSVVSFLGALPAVGDVNSVKALPADINGIN